MSLGFRRQMPNAAAIVLCVLLHPGLSHAESEWHWRLAGTLVGPGHHQAVFAQTGETRAVQEGQQIDGWTLTAVRQRGVTLTSAGVVRSLSMEGYSPEEQEALAQQRAEESQRMNAAVEANLANQERDIDAANNQLAAATQQMQRNSN